MIHIRKFNRTSLETQAAFWSGFFICMVTLGPTCALIGAIIGSMGK
ncbi:hypothetical protein V6767_20305 [Martelella sp. FLE1502]